MESEKFSTIIVRLPESEKKSVFDAAHDARVPMGTYLRELHKTFGADFVKLVSDKRQETPSA